MLVDIRHKPSELDKDMLAYLTYNAIPFKIVATKADKIAKSKVGNYVKIIAKELNVMPLNILAYSSETLLNKDKILDIIENDINI